MLQASNNLLHETIQRVDEARRQVEVEGTALYRLLREGQIQIDADKKRQAELRQEKAEQLKTEVERALAQTYTGPKIKEAHYLSAAYDHLATGRANLDAFAWKESQLAAQLHSEEACRQQHLNEREAIERQAQELTLDDLFPTGD